MNLHASIKLVLVLNLPETWANRDTWSPYLSKTFNIFLTLRSVTQQKQEVRKAKVLNLGPFCFSSTLLEGIILLGVKEIRIFAAFQNRACVRNH